MLGIRCATNTEPVPEFGSDWVIISHAPAVQHGADWDLGQTILEGCGSLQVPENAGVW